MKEEAKRLHEDLMKNSKLVDALKDVFEHGTPEEQVKAANELGYKISLEDVQPLQREELEDEELEAVSGGALWCLFGGEYAKDGKEVGCWEFSYKDWNQANRKICPKGSEEAGWYHEWVDKVEVNAYYDKWTCKKCGEVRVVSISAW